MFDLDPRDVDSRDEERYDNNPSRGRLPSRNIWIGTQRP